MQTVQLLQVTDPHLFGDPATELYGVNTAESLRLTLAAALADGPAPDAVLVTGDIGDDMSAAAYANFRHALARCGSARLGSWGAVLLDTHVPGRPHGRLSDRELERLDALLREMHGVPVLVCLHHPPVPVGSAWLDGVGLMNGDAFFEVVDRHANVRCVLAGHVHQEFDAWLGPVRVLTSPSTCAQFLPRTGRCVMDQRPPGYRWFELYPDGALKTGVERVAPPVRANGLTRRVPA